MPHTLHRLLHYFLKNGTAGVKHDCTGPSYGPCACVSNAPNGNAFFHSFGSKSANSIRSLCRSLVSPLTVCIASYSNPWYWGLLCLLVVVTTEVRGAVRGNATATALPSSGCHLSIFFGDVNHEFVPGSAHCNNQYGSAANRVSWPSTFTATNAPP